MSDEYIQITALLTQEQISFLDSVAHDKGVRGRQAPLRWAIEHYRAFLLSQRSTYQIIRSNEEELIPTAEQVAA